MPMQDHYDAAPLWAWLRTEERSVNWLARKTGVPESTLRALKGNHRPVTAQMAARIAGALGMQITELFAPSGDA
jgi:plasmid maintenance system antidote protein VapI